MKLHELHFANINCLAGEWKIDLEDPALADGLFVLSGPTGAGKSSILDAATLALYGRTARQGAVSGNSNEVMTQGAEGCFAKAVFTGADGRRYEAGWAQQRVRHRGGAKGGGDFTAPEASLRDLESGEDLSCHRARDTRALIEEKAGYGFGEFTRTVVLEQGEFDKFLHAAEEDRGGILEKATDTSRFSEAGRRVNERHKEEDRRRAALVERVATLRGVLEGVRDPEEAEEEAKEHDRAAAEAGARAEGLRREARWLEEAAGLAKEEKEIAEAGEALEGRRGARDEAVEAVSRAERARALRGEAAAVEGARRTAESAKEEAEKRAGEAVAAAEAVPEAEERARGAGEKERAALEALEAAKPVLAEARRLDGEAALAARSLEEARAAEKEPLAALGEAEKRAAEAGKAAEKASGRARKARKDLEGAKARVAAAGALREAAEKAEEGRRGAEEEYEAAARGFEEGREAYERRMAVLEERQRWAEAVKSLEARRRELRAGEPCPLCGATEHPWAAGMPAADDVRAEMAREKQERTGEERRVRRLEGAAKAARGAAEEASAAWRKEDAGAREGLARAEASLAAAVAEVKRRGEELPAAAAGIAAARERVAAAGERTRRREESWTAAVSARKALPVADADARERELAAGAKEASEKRAAAEKALALARQKAANAAEEAEKARAAAEEAAGARETAERAFGERLAECGFGGEAEWAAACMAEEAFAAAKEAVERFAKDAAELAGRKAAWEKRRAEHASAAERPAEGRGAAEVAAELASAEGERKAAIEAAAALRGANRERAARLAELAKAESELAAQEERCRKWAFLDDCLGGPDGKRFQRYAQGRNLRVLLDDASPRLEAMSGGDYRFEWDPSGGTLEPLVRDRHFEAPRPVSNLSGGESFLASLALALSFSRFNAKRAAVGTLFLDEGFGTLDAEALDRALDVLSGLRDTGRQVGLVTHVEQVKERVPAHIDVRKRGDGRSELSGPGVEALGNAGHGGGRKKTAARRKADCASEGI